MLGHFQIFVSAPVFGVNFRFWYPADSVCVYYVGAPLLLCLSILSSTQMKRLKVIWVGGYSTQTWLARLKNLKIMVRFDCCKYYLPSGRDVEGELTGS